MIKFCVIIFVLHVNFLENGCVLYVLYIISQNSEIC